MLKRMLLSGAAVGLVVAGAQAGNLIIIDGDTTGEPTYNRTIGNDFGSLSGTGTDVPYDTIPFVVAPGGQVRLETVVPQNFDTYLFVYTDFDPADATQNGVFGNDDGGDGLLSLIDEPLSDGQYIAVVTGFSNSSFGVYRLELEGPVFVGTVQGDAGVMVSEFGPMVTAAQTQGLRQLVRANSNARQMAAAGSGGRAISMNGNSTSGFSVWAEIGGGQLDGDFGEEFDMTNFYGQAGVEAALSGGLSLGLGIGGALTNSDTLVNDLDGDALFVQPYLAYSDGALTAVASFVYTRTDYDDSTNTIDDSNRYAGSLSVGYGVPIGDGTTMTPFGYLSGGTEDLDTSSGSEDYGFLTGRLGVEFSHNTELLNTGTLNAFGSLAAEYVNTDDPGLGSPALLADHDDDRVGGRVELGFDFTIAGTSTQLMAAANASGLFTDATGYGGRLGLKIPF